MKRAFFTIKNLESTTERLYQKITELTIQNDGQLLLTDPPRKFGMSDVKILEVTYDDGRDITFKLITDSDAFLLSTAYGTSKECCDCIDQLKKFCDMFEKTKLTPSNEWEEICSSQIGVKENNRNDWEEICSSQIIDDYKKSEVKIDGEKMRIELNKKLDDYYKENINTTTTTSQEELQTKVNDVMKTLQSLSQYTKSSSKFSTNLEERATKLQETITTHGKRIEEYSHMVQHQQTQMRRELYILATLVLIFLVVFL